MLIKDMRVVFEKILATASVTSTNWWQLGAFGHTVEAHHCVGGDLHADVLCRHPPTREGKVARVVVANDQEPTGLVLLHLMVDGVEERHNELVHVRCAARHAGMCGSPVAWHY